MKIINHRNDIILKIISIIGFTCVILSTITIMRNINSKSYSLSLYGLLPPLFYFFIIMAIISGIAIVLLHIFLYKKRSYLPYFGISIILLCNSIILFQPLIQGFLSYGRWDIPMHIGWTLDIIQTNELSNFLVYPITHLFIAIISLTTNCSLTIIINFLIPSIIFFYFLFILILSKFILKDERKILFSLIFSSILLFSYVNYQVLPNTFANFFIPFILYVYFKFRNEKNIKSIFILFIIFSLIPFFHPLSFIILISAFILIDLICILFLIDMERNKKYSTLSLLLFPIIIFIFWLSLHYGIWKNNIQNLYSWILSNGESETVAIEMLQLLKKHNLNFFETFEILIRIYGHVIIFLILVGISAILLFNNYRIHQKKFKNLILLIIGYFCLTFFLLIFNTFFTILNLGFWRILLALMIVSPLIIGFGLDEIIKCIYKSNYNRNKLLVLYGISLFLIINICSLIGIFNTYPSPYTLQANQQITDAELNGMDWYYTSKDPFIIDYPLKMDYRYFIMLYGSNNPNKRKDILFNEKQSHIPNHFNYHNTNELGEYLKTNAYLPLSIYEINYYGTLYSNLNEFSFSDFLRLDCDKSIDFIYNNNDLKVLKINY